jgi:hypothetical protein
MSITVKKMEKVATTAVDPSSVWKESKINCMALHNSNQNLNSIKLPSTVSSSLTQIWGS